MAVLGLALLAAGLMARWIVSVAIETDGEMRQSIDECAEGRL